MHGPRLCVGGCVWVGCGLTPFIAGGGVQTLKKSRNHFLSSNNSILVDFGSWVIFHDIMFADPLF